MKERYLSQGKDEEDVEIRRQEMQPESSRDLPIASERVWELSGLGTL